MTFRPVIARAEARVAARDRIDSEIAAASAQFYRAMVGALLSRRLIFCYGYEPEQIEGRVETFHEQGVYSAEFHGEGGEVFAASLNDLPPLPVIGPKLQYAETDDCAMVEVRGLIDVAAYVNPDAEVFARARLSARLAAIFHVRVEDQTPKEGADVHRYEGEPNLYVVEIVGPDGATYGGNYREGTSDVAPGIQYSPGPGFDCIEVETLEQAQAYKFRRTGGDTAQTVGGVA